MVLAVFHGRLLCKQTVLVAFHGRLLCRQTVLVAFHGRLLCRQTVLVAFHGQLLCRQMALAVFHGRSLCKQMALVAFRGQSLNLIARNFGNQFLGYLFAIGSPKDIFEPVGRRRILPTVYESVDQHLLVGNNTDAGGIVVLAGAKRLPQKLSLLLCIHRILNLHGDRSLRASKYQSSIFVFLLGLRRSVGIARDRDSARSIQDGFWQPAA
jgi:hypothetical protein